MMSEPFVWLARGLKKHQHMPWIDKGDSVSTRHPEGHNAASGCHTAASSRSPPFCFQASLPEH